MKETYHLQGLGEDGRIILQQRLEKQGDVWIGYIWLRIWSSGGICEHGNEPSGSTKGGKYLAQVSDYQLLHGVN